MPFEIIWLIQYIKDQMAMAGYNHFYSAEASTHLFPKPLLRCLGSVLSVIILLEGEHFKQSEVLSALEQDFIKDLSVL